MTNNSYTVPPAAMKAASRVAEAVRLHYCAWGPHAPSRGWEGHRRLCATVFMVDADPRVRVVRYRSPWGYPGLAVFYDRRHVATVFYPSQREVRPWVCPRDPELDRTRGWNAPAVREYEAARREAGRLLREGLALPYYDGQEGGCVILPGGHAVSALGALCAAHSVTRREAIASGLWDADADVRIRPTAKGRAPALALRSALPPPTRLTQRGGGGARRLVCEEAA